MGVSAAVLGVGLVFLVAGLVCRQKQAAKVAGEDERERDGEQVCPWLWPGGRTYGSSKSEPRGPTREGERSGGKRTGAGEAAAPLLGASVRSLPGCKPGGP